MKVEFRQNCEIQGQKFGFEKHMKPGIHEVPGSFKDDWYFKALLADNKLSIIEESEDDSIIDNSDSVSDSAIVEADSAIDLKEKIEVVEDGKNKKKGRK